MAAVVTESTSAWATGDVSYNYVGAYGDLSKSAVYVSLLLCTGFILIHIKKKSSQSYPNVFLQETKTVGPKTNLETANQA